MDATISLGTCPACGEPREQNRGDAEDRLCWRCRSPRGKMADVFLAAREGDTTRIPLYEELIGLLRARYDDQERPRLSDLELLGKLRGDLRAHLAAAEAIADDIDATEWIMQQPTAEVLQLVRSLGQPMSRYLSPDEWSKMFQLNWRTIKRRIDEGVIVARFQNRKSWSIRLSDVPEKHRASVA
jgi:hypothetical protein